MSRVLEKVAKTATVVPAVSMEEIERLQVQHDALLGVEADARKELKKKIDTLVALRTAEGLPLLDKRVFRWRWSQKIQSWNWFRAMPLPKVVLVRTDDPHVILSSDWSRHILAISGNRTNEYRDHFPQAWKNELSDVFDVLKAIARSRNGTTRLHFTWKGVMTEEARQIVRENEEKYDGVYLLAESPYTKWKLDNPPRPAFIDPLIVGHRNGNFVLLGSFNPTKLEDYIGREFVT